MSYLESFDSTEVLSLSFDLLGLIISLFELTGGNDMECTNIVVGIGFTRGDQAIVSLQVH